MQWNFTEWWQKSELLATVVVYTHTSNSDWTDDKQNISDEKTQISQFLKLRTGLPASITSKHFLLPTNIIKVTLNKENKDEDCEVKWQHHATVEAVDITHRKIQEICGATFFFKSPAKLVWQDQETQIN